VDSKLKGIKVRLQPPQRKMPVPDVEEADLEIACTFDYSNPVQLIGFVVVSIGLQKASQRRLIYFEADEGPRSVRCGAVRCGAVRVGTT